MLWLLAVSGCVSTAIVDQWRDPSYSGPPLHKVLVVGVRRDQRARHVWEDGMVAALQREGVQATPSYTVFPNKAPTADELAKTARADEFDGVVATHIVKPSQRYYRMPGYWLPGYAAPELGSYRWRNFSYWKAIYDPGYGVPGRRGDYQTDVLTVNPKGGMLIWTGITRSVNLDSLRDTIDQISRVLVPQLVADGILIGKPG